MLFVISPAKSLDESPVSLNIGETQSDFLDQSQALVNQLKEYGPVDIAGLMGLSDKLSELNYQRFQDWQLPMPSDHARPAAFLFKGDVYQGLDIRSLDEKQVSYLQKHLGILSGLYGIVRPMDVILPYRLEMGTSLENTRGKNLYQFWGNRLTDWVNSHLEASTGRVLVNLASNEYFKAVNPKKINATVITPQFKDWKNGQYKMISFYAKKARGLMVRYAAVEQIEQVEDLKHFDYEGYRFAPDLSNATDWVFTRRQED
ncbi:peroxide stress protein YaaA [Hydrogenovibrio marinus]|uniref:UPF0246 protein EI16_11440 n=1 Tax=Hydrogenovibrio marinus TaxID=28885 RepID=A0A066ZTL8_HYDMR|nr:peroxide stress protein YaaA [Hydrogenovibrio marinus]KDN96842.1 hypothetical protein EI16_11440 [Hydrogenovibrio marinus]BBN59099.1 UPF0246 protein [Hydrogenovibrio marinus]